MAALVFWGNRVETDLQVAHKGQLVVQASLGHLGLVGEMQALRVIPDYLVHVAEWEHKAILVHLAHGVLLVQLDLPVGLEPQALPDLVATLTEESNWKLL